MLVGMILTKRVPLKRGKKPRTVDTYRVSSRRKQRVDVRQDYGTYKSMYLSGGYKADIQGKPTEFET